MDYCSQVREKYFVFQLKNITAILLVRSLKIDNILCFKLSKLFLNAYEICEFIIKIQIVYVIITCVEEVERNTCNQRFMNKYIRNT